MVWRVPKAGRRGVGKRASGSTKDHQRAALVWGAVPGRRGHIDEKCPWAGLMTLSCVVTVWQAEGGLEYFDGQVTLLPELPSQSIGYSRQPTSRR